MGAAYGDAELSSVRVWRVTVEEKGFPLRCGGFLREGWDEAAASAGGALEQRLSQSVEQTLESGLALLERCHPGLQPLEAVFNPRKAVFDLREAGVDLREAGVDLCKVGVDLCKVGVDLCKVGVDLVELLQHDLE